MSRPVFSFRPNMANPEHRRAWEILRSVPEGQKNVYLVQAILRGKEKEDMAIIVRRAIHEELGGSAMACPKPKKAGEIPEQMLDFLARMDGL